MRQNYVTDDTEISDILNPTYSHSADDFGFIHCPWSKTCNADAKEWTYTNVRRYPTTRLRILEMLDEIFE